jgi:asparagine synthase (glutamine-hydrolysing)
MLRTITHRGPDDEGLLVDAQAALGMRRLAIIDRSGGHQPMSGEDGAVSIVFNGEIYNHVELQRELETRGHTFRTRSDTEAIVHAYEEYGTDCVRHLRGMFAFAIWDRAKSQLFLARDRAGKKPLYYTTLSGGTLVFGSELKAVLAYPEVRAEISIEALDAYLTLGYVPDPLSICRDVAKLPPGHYLTFAGGHSSTHAYWDFCFETAEPRTEEDYVAELRSRLEDAVRVRLMAEVPLGAFLSGGIDSSTVVGLMSRQTNRPVKTFSIGFHEDSYSELKYARMIARQFGTDHKEFIVTPDICAVVDELVWHFDEPFADSSAIPTYMVAKLARDDVTVVLTGDGGDELFGGYTRYVVDRRRSLYGRIPRSVRRSLLAGVAHRLPHGAWGRNYLHNVSLDPIDRYIDSVSFFNSVQKRSLYSPALRAQLGNTQGVASELRASLSQVKTKEALDRLLYLDSKTYLPGDILTKVDRMTMAVSLEARAPLLDQEVIDFATRVPASMKLRGFETKHILKRAVRGLVPDTILDRPKQGFGIPIQQWINGQLRDRIRSTLTETRTEARGYFEPRYVTVLMDEHERGRRDHSSALWALFMLELWHRTFVDGTEARVSTPTPALVS